MRINYVMVFVSDMKRSVAFYRDIIGLPLRFESPHWTEFDTGGTTLALHPSKLTADAHDEIPAGQCRPGLSVPNLDEFHRRMVQANVRCIEEPRDLFGARVAQYADPDGLAISVGEDRG